MSEPSIRIVAGVSLIALIFSIISLLLIHKLKAIRLLGCRLSTTGEQNRLILLNDFCYIKMTVMNPTNHLVRIMILDGTLLYQHRRYNIQSKYVEIPANSLLDILCEARVSRAYVRGKYGCNFCEIQYQYSPPGMWKPKNKMYSEAVFE